MSSYTGVVLSDRPLQNQFIQVIESKQGQGSENLKNSPSLLDSSTTLLLLRTIIESQHSACVGHINRHLSDDIFLREFIPIDPTTNDLFDLAKDGVLLCKLINIAVPGTINEKEIHMKQNINPLERNMNYSLCLKSAKDIGCTVVKFEAQDLAEGRPCIVLRLISEIIKIQYLGDLSHKNMPQSVEKSFLDYTNFFLEGSSFGNQLTELSSDVEFGEAYASLLKLASKHSSLAALVTKDPTERANLILDHPEEMDPKDIIASFADQIFQQRTRGLSMDKKKLSPPKTAMPNYDLTPQIAPNLDLHLVLPLLDVLQEWYPNDQILKTKMELLNKTSMVDHAMDIHRSLNPSEDVPQDMVERRMEVIARLKALKEAAAPLVACFQNTDAVQELGCDNQYNIQMLKKMNPIEPEHIEALYDYGNYLFECGHYPRAADCLYQYRVLCTNDKRSLSALWRNLAAEILMQNWDRAIELLNLLKEIIDSKKIVSPSNEVQYRVRLMHWSLFIFFNNEKGTTQMIDLFSQGRYLNMIQTNAPHLLRYLATAFVVNKRRRPQLIEFIKVIIQPEQYCFKDPITEFLACVYVTEDFDGAKRR